MILFFLMIDILFIGIIKEKRRKYPKDSFYRILRGNITMKQEKINKIIKELDELKSFTESHIINKNIIDYVTDIVSEIKNDIDIGWIFQNPFTETTRILVEDRRNKIFYNSIGYKEKGSDELIQRIDHFLYTLW